MRAADEVMFYMDGFQYLGEHGGLYYVAGYPTDTALEFYSNWLDIDGAAGSGKTTLAAKLVDMLHANLVHSDDI